MREIEENERMQIPEAETAATEPAKAPQKKTRKATAKTAEPDADLSFEAALTKLEELVKRLEDGQVPLEDSLRDYEEAIRLVRLCSGKLDTAEQSVRVLQKTENGIGEFPMPLSSVTED